MSLQSTAVHCSVIYFDDQNIYCGCATHGETLVVWREIITIQCLLAPTGALVLMMVYYISAAAAATFSDFEHLCLSILLQVSL